MNKKILSLDLGITSIGYSILDEIGKDRYKLIDYGVSMFDKATDAKGNSKKLLHSASKSSTNLKKLRKERKQNLAKLFEKHKLGSEQELLKQEKENVYTNKWYLRAEKVFTEKLNINEFFTILYLIAKHRGYKSLDTNDLLEELLEKLGFEVEETEAKKGDEKGEIKKSLKTIELLKKESSEKTVARIIYEVEIKKENPTFRNHDNYNYMIRREYIREELEKLVESQKAFGLFTDGFDIETFIQELKETIDDQKDSTNDLSLFGNCEYYPKYKVAHQYSLLSDIFKMYQSVANITFGKINISKEQIQVVADWFFKKVESGKNIAEIKYQDIRTVLKLSDEVKVFGKDDYHLSKTGSKVFNTITKFHFLSSLGKIDNSFIKSTFQKENKLEILQEIFDVLEFEKAPKTIYIKLKEIFLKYDLVANEKLRDKTIIDLIKNKSGNSLNISAYAMRQFIPFFEEGLTTDEIKKKLALERNEDYSTFKKGIKYLGLSFDNGLEIEIEDKKYKASQFEYDSKLLINNHPVKYVVSATMRLVKHLHSTYGSFDEIRVESTRELSQNEETKKAIEKANKENEKKFQEILDNKTYQDCAIEYGKNLKRYARKIIMWEEQEFRDIYLESDKNGIGLEDIFSDKVDIDHIIPQSLGGLSVKHNLVLCFKNTNLEKNNYLPMQYVKNKEKYIYRVEALFKEYKINWKKKINLLAITLDETYKDTFESKSLRATSYIEALTAQMLKRYYPFPDKQKQANGQAVSHVQGRATSNIRKLLKVKTKVRDTNIHHAIDAILIGLTNKSWLQKLSNTFRENMGVIDDEARAKIKKELPLIEGIEPKELVKLIEDAYNIYGEESVFYKDIFGNLKSVNFWVSKKPMSSKIHKDTIYAKKANNFFTVREDIIKKFIALKITVKTDSEKFKKDFEKKIRDKMYVYKINPKDNTCLVVQQRADEIKSLLDTFVGMDLKNKELVSNGKEKIDELIHRELVDQNGNILKKVKFYQNNLTGFEIRGGLASTEKTFIGFKALLENNKIVYERIDAANFQKIKRTNDGSFKVYKNDVLFFIYEDGSYKGGKIVSFLEDKKLSAFSNPKYPSAYKFQPNFYCKDKEHTGAKQIAVGKAIGIIKLNLDILGNIKSYSKFGEVSREVELKIFHKE